MRLESFPQGPQRLQEVLESQGSTFQQEAEVAALCSCHIETPCVRGEEPGQYPHSAVLFAPRRSGTIWLQ